MKLSITQYDFQMTDTNIARDYNRDLLALEVKGEGCLDVMNFYNDKNPMPKFLKNLLALNVKKEHQILSTVEVYDNGFYNLFIYRKTRYGEETVGFYKVFYDGGI